MLGFTFFLFHFSSPVPLAQLEKTAWCRIQARSCFGSCFAFCSCALDSWFADHLLAFPSVDLQGTVRLLLWATQPLPEVQELLFPCDSRLGARVVRGLVLDFEFPWTWGVESSSTPTYWMRVSDELCRFVHVIRLKRLSPVGRFHRASSGDFLLCLESYKVTKVTMVFRNVQFFLLKQGFRSYAVSKVTVLFTRFQKLQGSKCCNSFTIFQARNSIQSYKVTKLRGYDRNFRQIHPRILPYLLSFPCM